MKANIFLILLFAGLFNFKSKDVSAYKVSSIFTVDSLPNKILIINSFDARSIKARKNKKITWIIVYMHHPLYSFGWSHVTGWQHRITPKYRPPGLGLDAFEQRALVDAAIALQPR